jgi:hypothetical protein
MQRVHSRFEAHTPRCAECHVEHRGALLLLTGRSADCVRCHARLVTTRSPPAVQPEITSFATHPAFRPLRAGQSDQAALRFNHRIHLTSDKIAAADKLSCASCHQVDQAGARMRAIRFERHCKRCHKQEVQGPVGSIEALHASPERVRADLLAQLAALGIRDADAIFAPPSRPLPGVRAAPIDESRTLREYQARWLERLEAVLYRPLQEPAGAGAGRAGLLEANKYCFLCHLPGEADAAGDLPAIKPTRIPRRWLVHAEFSHHEHDLLACQACHGNVERSERTGETNLPAKERCLECHVDGVEQSAGTACVLCHLYHDTSKDAALRNARRRALTIDMLVGKELPPATPATPP